MNQYKLSQVRKRYYPHRGLDFNRGIRNILSKREGYFNELKSLENSQKDKPCFILAGGPSIKTIDLSKLKGHLLIGLNGSYMFHASQQVLLTYLMIEDEYTLTTAKSEIEKLRNVKILLSEQNSRQLYQPNRILYFRTNYKPGSTYWKKKLMFSTQFHYIAFLGGTVTYLALQFAFHLGCNPIYILGLDFNYGERFQKKLKSQQGKSVVIDEELLDILKETHHSSRYLDFKTGQLLNVPNFDLQHRAFQCAREVAEGHGVQIINLNPSSQLDVFEKKAYNSVFN